MTNTVTKIEANFGRSLGNGANMGKYTLEAFKTVLDQRDTTILVGLLQQAKKRDDTLAERAIKFMINIVYNGAKIDTSKNKKWMELDQIPNELAEKIQWLCREVIPVKTKRLVNLTLKLLLRD